MCVHSAIPGCCTPTDPKVGTPCDVPMSPYDKPPCKPGAFVCMNGMFTCVGSQKPSFEICDGLDNNCDGIVDDANPNGPPLCAPGNVCLDGVCVGPCSTGEFPCKDYPGTACVDGYCIPTDCAKVHCPMGQTCNMGVCSSADGGPTTSSSSSSGGTGGGTSASSSSSSSSSGAGAGGSGTTGSSSASSGATSSSGGVWGLATGGACRCGVVGASEEEEAPRGGLLLAALGLLALGRRSPASRRRKNVVNR
jgi:hypothetical protein